VSEAVGWACEMLGLNYLYWPMRASSWRLSLQANTESVLAAMRKHAYGRLSTLIGRVTEEHPGRVVIKNPFGVQARHRKYWQATNFREYASIDSKFQSSSTKSQTISNHPI